MENTKQSRNHFLVGTSQNVSTKLLATGPEISETRKNHTTDHLGSTEDQIAEGPGTPEDYTLDSWRPLRTTPQQTQEHRLYH